MVHGGVVSKMGVTLASCYAGCTSIFPGDGVATGSGSFVLAVYIFFFSELNRYTPTSSLAWVVRTARNQHVIHSTSDTF